MSDMSEFFGQRIIRHEVALNGLRFQLDAVRDASALLDVSEFARRFEITDAAPYGLELWPAAAHLAAEILAAAPGQGRSAVELGCGLGLVAIAAARAGWSVTATDHDEYALDFCLHNAGLNGIDIVARPFDWSTGQLPDTFELILAADVLYEQRNHQPIAHCIRTHLTSGGAAMITDPNRAIADAFPRVAEQAGLHITEHARPANRDIATDARLFRIGRGSRKSEVGMK